MTVKKALAQYAGKIDELHAGDTLAAGVIGFTGTNVNASPITIGRPVYKTATAGEVDLANATDDTKSCIGLVADASIASASPGVIQTVGVISMADWTSIIGTTNLTPGAIYFLDTTAGLLTAISPSTSGNVSQIIGRADSATELSLDIRERILLA